MTDEISQVEQSKNGVVSVSPADAIADSPQSDDLTVRRVDVERLEQAYRVWTLSWVAAGLPTEPKQDDSPENKLQFVARAAMGDAIAALRSGRRLGLEERALRMLDAITGDSAQTGEHLREYRDRDVDQNQPFSHDARVRAAWTKLVAIQDLTGRETEAGKLITSLASGVRAPLRDGRPTPKFPEGQIVRDTMAERLFTLLCTDSNLPVATAKIARDAVDVIVASEA